jgi:hypothetical protein
MPHHLPIDDLSQNRLMKRREGARAGGVAGFDLAAIQAAVLAAESDADAAAPWEKNGKPKSKDY